MFLVDELDRPTPRLEWFPLDRSIPAELDPAGGHGGEPRWHHEAMGGGWTPDGTLIEFVRSRGVGVIATADPSGAPEAALMRLAITDDAELIFDTGTRSRKLHNIRERPHVAAVIGWDDHVSIQLEGMAEIPTGANRERCVAAYLAQHPNMQDRAESSHVAHVRVRVTWVRYADFRPASRETIEFTATTAPASRRVWTQTPRRT